MPKKSTHRLDIYLHRLGKEPDQQIAAEAGVSRSLILSFRKKHDISAYEGYKFGADNPPPAARAAAERAATGTPKPPKAVPKTVKNKRKNKPKNTAKPGTTVAFAVATPSVAVAGDSFRGRRSALDAYVDMLGKVPDADIAKLADVTSENVRTYRSRRGIGANWSESGKSRVGRPRKVIVPPADIQAAPAVAPPTAMAAPTAAKAIFSVTVEVAGMMRVYAVAARTITDGVAVAHALVARKHPNGIVKGIAHIAEFLS